MLRLTKSNTLLLLAAAVVAKMLVLEPGLVVVLAATDLL